MEASLSLSGTTGALHLDTTTYRKEQRHARGIGFGPPRTNLPARRSSSSIRSLLIHTTNNPRGNTDYRPEARFLVQSPDVSAHYVVSSHDSTVVQVLSDLEYAWHAGDCADNDYENTHSIGIEIAWAEGKGPLPQIAWNNLTKLVRSCMAQYPTITNIDMHRRQAIPVGRKRDPSGVTTEQFDAWRATLLREPPSALALLWGDKARYAVGWGIPDAWATRANALGAALGPEVYSDGYVTQAFANGLILYNRVTGKAMVRTYTEWEH